AAPLLFKKVTRIEANFFVFFIFGSSGISVGISGQFWGPDSVWTKHEFPSERVDNPWTTSLLPTGCPH
ncbi:MAG: hypothetical protein WCH04_20550, partial [Gammaproteobacteria bacterium]